MITLFSYGGATGSAIGSPGSILLDMAKVHAMSQEAVYDGPTYLWTRFLLHVTGVYNPAATSYLGGVLPGGTSPTATAAPGRIAAATDAAIRHILEQPRRQLILAIVDGSPGTGVTTWLSSPLPGMRTDANNGPTPRYLRIIEEVGGQTALVEFVIEVCVNECPSRVTVSSPGVGLIPVARALPPIVLSHRWEATDAIDLDSGYLTTRSVQGYAVLRSDAMLAAGVIPDDFRRAFFHPVMANCQREDIRVRATEDGHRLEYSFTDSEQMFNLTSAIQRSCPGLVSLDAGHSSEIGKPNFDDLILGIAGVANRTLRNTITVSTGTIGTIPGAIAVAAATVLDLGVTITQMVPRQAHSVIARAFGDRTATRKNLEGVALQFCRARINAVRASGSFFGIGLFLAQGTAWFHVNYSWERNRKVVEVSLRVKQGMGGAAIDTLFGQASAAAPAPAPQQGRPSPSGPATAAAAGVAQGPSGLNTVGGLATTVVGAGFGPVGQIVLGGPGQGGVTLSQLNPLQVARRFVDRFTTLDTTIMPGEVPDGSVIQQSPVPNPGPANSGMTRGTLVESLVAQVLQGGCSLPARPALLGPATTRERSSTI